MTNYFKEDFIWSELSSKWAKERLYHFFNYKIHKVHNKDLQKHGIDFAFMKEGKIYGIEVKQYRTCSYERHMFDWHLYNGLNQEIYIELENAVVPGWAIDDEKKSDYIAFLYEGNKEYDIVMIYDELRNIIKDNLDFIHQHYKINNSSGKSSFAPMSLAVIKAMANISNLPFSFARINYS